LAKVGSFYFPRITPTPELTLIVIQLSTNRLACRKQLFLKSIRHVANRLSFFFSFSLSLSYYPHKAENNHKFNRGEKGGIRNYLRRIYRCKTNKKNVRTIPFTEKQKRFKIKLEQTWSWSMRKKFFFVLKWFTIFISQQFVKSYVLHWAAFCWKGPSSFVFV